MEKQKILIVDDSEMNRVFLADILEGQYDVTEAENGREAVEILAGNESDFWFVLLDIMMPEMDGFDVLNYINDHYWNDRVVVMMISSDGSPDNINRAYSLGAFDYIGRPFDPMIVRKRIANTLMLYARQHDLENTVKEQFLEQQKNNDLMISILSHIVEFRNGESGVHIQHVKDITETLLKCLARCTSRYGLSDDKIALIKTASAIHDVGKIAIPQEILNKPGRLTTEEFEIMKTHTTTGAEMLSNLPAEQASSPLVSAAYEICRWHHERYDGRGYPDGLKGERIPIGAQVVALADVYDALTSERCYKKAIPHEQALSMIHEGKCGVFNPLLLQCLDETSDALRHLKEDAGSASSVKAGGTPRADEPRGRHETSSGLPEYMQLLYIDPLTGVYNRRYFQEYIQDSPDIEAVVLIGIDNFANLVEVSGREAGDAALRQAGRLLLSLTRQNDPVIRFDDGKFLIAFRSMTKSAFKPRLEALRQHFTEPAAQEQPQASMSIYGFWGPGRQEALFSMAKSAAQSSESAGGQMVIRFLDE